MIHMIKVEPDLGHGSISWKVYRDGYEVYKGIRRKCFNLIHRGNPELDAAVEVPEPE